MRWTRHIYYVIVLTSTSQTFSILKPFENGYTNFFISKQENISLDVCLLDKNIIKIFDDRINGGVPYKTTKTYVCLWGSKNTYKHCI